MSTDLPTPSTPPEAPQLFEPGDRVDKRYEVVRLIAQGGMGLVFEVLDRELSTTLALKAVKPHIARQSQTLDRFRREVQLSSRIAHPNVCRIYGAGLHRESSGLEVHYLTMELLDGETLSRRLRGSGPLDPSEAGPILHQMANGLAAAHRAGVVHRDLKCSNVILVPRDESDEVEGLWRAVLTDFGLSRSLIQEEETSRLTATGQLMGTPAYFAPELLDGHRLTAASDVYGFGVVAYEMLSGKLPFTGRSPFVVALRRLSEPPRPIRQLVPKLDVHWVRVLDRCLQRRPENRPSDGDALLELLDRKIGGGGGASDSDTGGLSTLDSWDLDSELAPLIDGTLEVNAKETDAETAADLWGDETPRDPLVQEGAPRARRPKILSVLAVVGLVLVLVALWLGPSKSPRSALTRLAIATPEIAEGAGPTPSQEGLWTPSQLRLILTWAASDRRELELVGRQTLAPLHGDPVEIARAAAAAEVLVSRLLPADGGWRVELERFSAGGTRRVWARASTVPLGGTRLLAHAVVEDLDRAFGDFGPRLARWDPLHEGGEAFDELLGWSLRLEQWIAEPGSVAPPSTEALESIRRRSGDALASRRLEARWQLALARRADTPRGWRQARAAFLVLDPPPADLWSLASPLPVAPSASELDLLRELLERQSPTTESSDPSCGALRLRGYLEQQVGRSEAAREALRVGAEQCPSWDLLADLARVEAALGERRVARDTFARALALAPAVESLRQEAAELSAPRVER